MLRVLLAFVYAACAIVALWPGVFELNAAIRGGIAAFFAGRAVASSLLFIAQRRARATELEHILRSYLVLSYAYVTGGILLGAGALRYGGMLGFAVAYAAFSIAWGWWWIRRTLLTAREEQLTP